MNDIQTRAKKFNEDHPRIVAFGAGVIIAGAFGARAVSKTKIGLRPVNAKEMVDDVTKTTYLYITTRNGKTGRFVWDKIAS